MTLRSFVRLEVSSQLASGRMLPHGIESRLWGHGSIESCRGLSIIASYDGFLLHAKLALQEGHGYILPEEFCDIEVVDFWMRKYA